MKTKLITTILVTLFLASILMLSLSAAAGLTLNPSSGPSGTIVTITGSGFTGGVTYRVYFDSNKDSKWNSGEPYKTVTASSAGTFTTTLTVPSVSPGSYKICAGKNVSPYSAIASAPFTVCPSCLTEWDKLLAIEKKLSMLTAIEGKLDIIEPEVHDIKGEMFAVTDHALFDTTGGDTGARCKSSETFIFYLVARAVGGPATIRVTFADSDWIEFPLTAADDIISFTQAAGGTPGVDDELIVTVISGEAVGWISIQTQNKATPDLNPPYSGSFCVTI